MWQKIRDGVKAVFKNPRAALKSAAQTVAGVGVALALLPSVAEKVGVTISIPADVLVWVTAASTFLRTLLVALNPKDKTYGVGS